MLIKHHGQRSLLIVGCLAAHDNEAIKQKQTLKNTKQEKEKMKKVNKTKSSKMGFTAVEMVLVIAIIVILCGATIVGIRAMLTNANKDAAAIELHAGCYYVEDPNGPATLPGTAMRIRVVDADTPGAQHYSNMDAMYDEARIAEGTLPAIN